MGLDFYKDALEMQKRINVNGAVINNSIQSNLTLLDEEMAKFIVDNNIHIGGSYDGINNELTRHNSNKILKGHKVLKDCGGRNGFICVVQRNNIDNLIEDYEWFKKNKMNYTINMYMSDNSNLDDPLFVEKEHYVKRICELFDYWVNDVKCNIQISYFDDFIDYILYKKKSLCCYNFCLGKHVGIHYNGDIYCCNRDFTKEFCFGNIYDYNDIRECFQSDGFENIVLEAVERRKQCKSECSIYDFCTGGCNSTALMGGKLSERNAYVCQILISIYEHIEKRIQDYLLNKDEKMKNELNPYFVCKLFDIK